MDIRAAALEAELATELVEHVYHLLHLHLAVVVEVPTLQQIRREALHRPQEGADAHARAERE